jgi:glycosyltransferase involved in cell wall biosynthesis
MSAGTRSVRILVAHDVPRARTGGMSRIMGFIHDRIAARGYAVDELNAEDVSSGGRVLRRFSFPIGVYRHARAAQRQRQPYALLNIHEPSAVPSLLGRRRLGYPRVVVTTHGVERRAWELALEEGRLGRIGPSPRSRATYPLHSLWQSRFGLTRADHILCLNEEDRGYLVETFGIDDARVTRIFPGADQAYAEASRDRAYTGARTLLFAGTWRKNKGIEDLVPAFSELLRLLPDLQLVVLGAGVPEDLVRRDFPVAARPSVSVVRTTNEAETARAFAAADLFVLPSLFEGTPLTLVEAMMSGLPIVTTAVCGMRDLIEHGRNGLLVPIRSPEALVGAVRDLVERPYLRRTLGAAAREDARTRYTWERSADRVATVYARLLGARSPSA